MRIQRIVQPCYNFWANKFDTKLTILLSPARKCLDYFSKPKFATKVRQTHRFNLLFVAIECSLVLFPHTLQNASDAFGQWQCRTTFIGGNPNTYPLDVLSNDLNSTEQIFNYQILLEIFYSEEIFKRINEPWNCFCANPQNKCLHKNIKLMAEFQERSGLKINE